MNERGKGPPPRPRRPEQRAPSRPPEKRVRARRSGPVGPPALTDLRFLAVASRGTEPMVRRELRDLGLTGLSEVPGGVTFRGDIVAGLRASLWSRVAMRVLVGIGSGPAGGPGALYDATRSLPIRSWFTPDHTISVHARSADSAVSHTRYAALKVKDAIVDALRESSGRRPNVAARDPDISVVVHLRDDVAHFYLDLAGRPLNQRGYRRREVDAPLKENVAAALLQYSGWNGRAPLHDPTCGSGTIAIEAAMIAADVAPSLGRSLGFERWPTFDAFRTEWQALVAEAKGRRKPTIRGVIIASDIDPKAVAATRTNLGVAGLLDSVIVREADVQELPALLGGGFYVFNPPYGERIGGQEADVAALYDRIGERLRSFDDHTAALITTREALGTHFGEQPVRAVDVLNGSLRCVMAVYRNDDDPSDAT